MSTDAIAAPRHGLRAYLAGTGVTGALVGAALVAFISVAAFVSSGGLPGVSSQSGPQHVVVRPPVNPSAQAAANAAAPAPAAVAAAPAAAIPAGAPGAPVITATTGPTGTATPPTGPVTLTGGTVPTKDGQGTTPPASGTATTPQQGVLGNTVSSVDNTTNNLGVNSNLSQTTQALTQPLDNTTRNLLNNVGGLLGDEHLGDTTTQALNGLTNGLLGGG